MAVVEVRKPAVLSHWGQAQISQVPRAWRRASASSRERARVLERGEARRRRRRLYAESILQKHIPARGGVCRRRRRFYRRVTAALAFVAVTLTPSWRPRAEALKVQKMGARDSAAGAAGGRARPNTCLSTQQLSINTNATGPRTPRIAKPQQHPRLRLRRNGNLV